MKRNVITALIIRKWLKPNWIFNLYFSSDKLLMEAPTKSMNWTLTLKKVHRSVWKDAVVIGADSINHVAMKDGEGEEWTDDATQPCVLTDNQNKLCHTTGLTIHSQWSIPARDTHLCRYLTWLPALCFLKRRRDKWPRLLLGTHSFLKSSHSPYHCFYVFNSNWCQSGPTPRCWRTTGASLFAAPDGRVDGHNLVRVARLDSDSGRLEVTLGPWVIFLLQRTSVEGAERLLIGCLDGWVFADVPHRCWIQPHRNCLALQTTLVSSFSVAADQCNFHHRSLIFFFFQRHA